jgi:hypothetical protein
MPLLFLPATVYGPDPVFETHLRLLASVVDWDQQRQLFRRLQSQDRNR